MVLHETIVRPRVALILPNLGGGGAERVALALAHHFVELGQEVDIVLLDGGGELKALVPTQARIIELGAKRLRSALLPLARYFRKRRPDATQAFMWPVTVLAVIAHRLAGRPGRLVISDHATLSNQYGPRRTLLRATTRLFYSAADERICVSDDVADDLVMLSGLKPDSIKVIPNPIVVPTSAPRNSQEPDKLWPAGGRRILTVGNLKPEKNHALLIQAIGILAQSEPVVLLILGEGPLRSKLEELIVDLNLADRITMPGFFLDPWPFYDSADLFVLSSDFEGYGLVLVEALHSGLRIVSTRCPGGPGKILEGGRYGRLVPVGDAAELARAIGEALGECPTPETARRRAEELSAGACSAHEWLMFGLSAGTPLCSNVVRTKNQGCLQDQGKPPDLL